MKVLDSRCVSSNTSLLLSQETAPMTPWQNRVTDLTRRMADDMKLRNYSQRTIDAYTYHLGCRFASCPAGCSRRILRQRPTTKASGWA